MKPIMNHHDRLFCFQFVETQSDVHPNTEISV